MRYRPSQEDCHSPAGRETRESVTTGVEGLCGHLQGAVGAPRVLYFNLEVRVSPEAEEPWVTS